MTRAFAMIMGGGSSEALSVLTEVRSEPAVPFGGKFRLIDFPLSNCVNSGIYNVAILTQYKPRSLNDHIGIGKPWDLDRAAGGVRLLQPYRGGPYGDWQKGTADAVRRNLDFVERPARGARADSGRRSHLSHGLHAHAAPACGDRGGRDRGRAPRQPHETHRYGIVVVDSNGTIVEFQEKPKRSRETLASMGIYIFRKDTLIQSPQLSPSILTLVARCCPPCSSSRAAVYAYTFPGYWADVGTVQAYWEANMSLLDENPALDLYDPNWVVHTRSQERAPSKVGPKGEQMGGNLIANGARIYGTVERSIISPGVYIAEDAIVRNSIILNDTVIEPGAVVDRCIVDKRVVIGAGAIFGSDDENTANEEMPELLNTGITLVGKNSQVPPGMKIGRNVVIHANQR